MGNELLELGIGKLGYGNMRLPKKDGKIDFDTIHQMIDTFLKSGNSYFDTAYIYENSENVLNEALVKCYPRDRYNITTKLALINANKPDEMKMQTEESLKRLGLDWVDFYLLHGLTTPTIEKADAFKAWDYLAGLKEQGIVKHIGFSFHGTPEELDMLLTQHPEIEYVQLQINYLDWDDPTVQSGRLYETVRKHNKPFTIMEPNKGGWLASTASDVGKLLKSANPDVSVASWAFRFVLGLEGLFVCLSGMGNVQEVEDNIHTFKNYKPLSEEEHGLLKQAVDIIRATPNIPCTGCGYCAPNCPKKIVIPGFMNLYNNYLKHKNLDTIKHIHNMCTMGDNGRPADCVQCGACEKHCPQHLEIRKVMSEVARIVGEG